MSDHDPNGDDDFLSNPMHSIGYGRGDDTAKALGGFGGESARGHRNDDSNMGHESVPHKPRVTQAYSVIDPNRIVNVGEKKVDPTVPMYAVEILTMKDIVHRLIERNLQAWKALPEKIRDAMMERPQEFQLIGNKDYNGSSKENFDYDILYNGTVWRYNGAGVNWVIANIVR